ncbi:ATP-binding cassette domain-containing protein [Aeropyrum camini]|uniref:ATP-binding cassette domain-containing protein n=1 Tax=Aeropyrum camini TaxID=229980 RepID=UPI00210B8B51|nr:ATP-binding cassette domain-containing protein [Aeropyrum camini]
MYLAGLARRLWLGFEKRAAARAFEILGWVGLDHMWDRRSGELSGGQMKLLEIARSIMKGAEMIIMDEPAAGVNPRLAGSIMERIKYLAREKGITFLIIEHRIGLVKEYVDWVYAMSMGRVIASGKPDEVLNNPVVLDSYLGG